VGGVVIEAFANISKGSQLAFDDHRGVVTVIFDEARAMGDDDHGLVSALLEEFDLTPCREASVTNRHDLIDEIAVEVDDHGEGEGQSGAHPGRVKAHGLTEVFTQFGKVLDVVKFVFEGYSIDPTDEAEVVQAGQMSLKTTGKGQGPRDAHVAADEAFGRGLRSAEKPDQGGLPAAITAEHAKTLPAMHGKVHPVEHGVVAGLQRIALGDVVEEDQGVKRSDG
jgi:hypothetical protein